MSYFVTKDATTGLLPYNVYEGTENVAGKRTYITCAQTLRGARRAIKKHQAARLAQHPDGSVYRELEFADLPDLRLSELAPS